MREFTDLIKDALTGGPPFQSQPGRAALEDAMRGYDRRARTMRWLTFFILVFMAVVTAWGLRQLVHSDQENIRMMLHGVFLTFFGLIGIAFAKLQLFLHQNHLMVMKELKGLAYLLLRGDEGERS